jgi:hypothetical protein
MHNTQDDKIYTNMTGTNCDLFTHNQSRSYLNHLLFATTTGFGLLAPGHHQVSVTGLDQSKGQDLVLLQYLLKVTIYFTHTSFITWWKDLKVRGGRGGSVKTLAKCNKLKS